MYDYGCNVKLRIEKMALSAKDLVDSFNCGNDNINELVQMDSFEPHTVTYLYIDDLRETLVAYASIACSGILVDDADSSNDEQSFTSESSIMSAVEIEYFAIDQEYQSLQFEENGESKLTLSYYVFMDMLECIRDISENVVGARAIVLYAVPDAVHFYQKCGFNLLPAKFSGRTDDFVDGCVPMFIYL